MAPAWSSALYCRDAHHQLNSFDEKRHITDTRFAVDTAAQRSFSLSGHGSTNSCWSAEICAGASTPVQNLRRFEQLSMDCWPRPANARASTSFACRLAGFAAADGIQSVVVQRFWRSA